MKIRIAFIMTAVLMTIGIVSCSATPSGVSVEVPYGDYAKISARPAVISQETQVPVNSILTITLPSNASTGYKWQDSATVADKTVLSQTDNQTVAPAAGSPPGAWGKQVWKFKALKAGVTTISMEYGRPWAGGEKGDWKFNLKVTVSP